MTNFTTLPALVLPDSVLPLFVLVGLYSGYYLCFWASLPIVWTILFLLRRYGWPFNNSHQIFHLPHQGIYLMLLILQFALSYHPCLGLGDAAAAFIFCFDRSPSLRHLSLLPLTFYIPLRNACSLWMCLQSSTLDCL